MIQHLTQTHLHPNGNCWQTCVAILLGVDPAILPDQHAIDASSEVGESYSNAIRKYLIEHRGLFYTEVYAHDMQALQPREEYAYHILCGPTIRTPETGAHHVVVARFGEMVWDPHPSRAGLTSVRSWGFLVPFAKFPKEWKDSWGRTPCVCPKCVPVVAS